MNAVLADLKLAEAGMQESMDALEKVAASLA
jgi:hypothetical protein